MENTIQRKIPFTPSEKELLTQIVAQHKVIEDKSINARNILLKKDAWKAVARTYNSSALTQKRNDHQLKRCWENMKSLRKRVLSAQAKEVWITPPPDPPSSLKDPLCPLVDNDVPGIVDFKCDEGANSRKLRDINREAEVRVEGLKIEQERELHQVKLAREQTIVEREKILLEREKLSLERDKNALLHEKSMQEFQRQREEIMLQKEKHLLQNLLLK